MYISRDKGKCNKWNSPADRPDNKRAIKNNSTMANVLQLINRTPDTK
jgi:hypothetical protein